MKIDKLSSAGSHGAASSESTWSVVCLCAAWCGVCRQYAPDFEGLQAKYPQVRFVWLDVEDRADVVGDVDVETFPTLLIGRGDEPMFLGPLLPQIKVLDRLLASLLQGEAASTSMPPEAAPLWRCIAAQWQ